MKNRTVITGLGVVTSNGIGVSEFWSNTQQGKSGNLKSLSVPTGFKVCCFPIKLTNADAAWSRVVAII